MFPQGLNEPKAILFKRVCHLGQDKNVNSFKILKHVLISKVHFFCCCWVAFFVWVVLRFSFKVRCVLQHNFKSDIVYKDTNCEVFPPFHFTPRKAIPLFSCWCTFLLFLLIFGSGFRFFLVLFVSVPFSFQLFFFFLNY